MPLNRNSLIWVFTLCLLPCFVYAHDGGSFGHSDRVIPAAVERSRVEINEIGSYRYVKSNGIPNHKTGAFPNKDNPNRISEQRHVYRVLLNPRKKFHSSEKGGVIGVALNGIPFEPGTAECYGQKRGSPPDPNCQWREEAIVNGKGRLGLDRHNAHVQPNGTYHYHGVPYGFIASVKPSGDLVHVGYAADGFSILYSRLSAYQSSYRIKVGERSSGPKGRYDGTYTADYEYVEGLKHLDECNGTEIDGQYVYFVTESFPYLPRCLMGVADESFQRHKGGGVKPQFGSGHRKPPPHRHPPPKFPR